jgi:regulatory protein
MNRMRTKGSSKSTDGAGADAYASALRILARRDHAELELRRKLLAKGYPAGPVEAAVARLRENGYLDDGRFARSYAESAIRSGRGFGIRILHDLEKRGVPRGTAEEALREKGEDCDEETLLIRLVERRYPAFDPAAADDGEIRRMAGYLLRRGFSAAAVRSVLQRGVHPQ